MSVSHEYDDENELTNSFMVWIDPAHQGFHSSHFSAQKINRCWAGQYDSVQGLNWMVIYLEAAM